MTFTAPENLIWALPVFIGLGYLYWWLEKRASAIALSYTNLSFMQGITKRSVLFERAVRSLFGLGLFLLCFAAAGPHISMKMPINAGTVVVCVDTSGSMQSSDVTPTRAQAAIDALHRFVRALGPQVRVGIVSFSTQAQADIQPTADRQALADAIDTIPKPNGATAIGDALSLAEQMMPPSGKRAIILLTDGVNNRGEDPLAVAHDLARKHIPVYPVGIGTQGSGQMIPGTGEEANTDPDALNEYAHITGGQSVVAGDYSGIVKAFDMLASSSIWEMQRIDASLISAIAGGMCVIATILVGVGAGKFP